MIQAAPRAPIFVVGMPRSGTTLLRLLLTAHSDVCIPPESMFFAQQFATYSATGVRDHTAGLAFVEALYTDRKFNEWQLDRQRLTEALLAHVPLTYAQAIATVYQQYLAHHAPAATYWGDKNPRYVYHLAEIFAVFPDARVVHILRHICGVYNSTRQPSFWPSQPESLLQIVSDDWRRVMMVAERYADHPHVLTIKYEDLLEAAEPVIRTVCAFLQLDFQASMFDFYRKNRAEALVPRHRLGWHQLTLQPVTRERANAWQHELPAQAIAYLQSVHQRRLRSLGYEIGDHFYCGQQAGPRHQR